MQLKDGSSRPLAGVAYSSGLHNSCGEPSEAAVVMKRGLLVWTVAVLLAACGATPRPSLPTLDSDVQVCADVHLSGTLAGSSTDPRVAWLVLSNGARSDIVWPPGYSARFDPDLAVLDASGKVVYRAGDTVEGGCVVGGDDSPRLVGPPG